jgi:predicted secreted hydrolase
MNSRTVGKIGKNRSFARWAALLALLAGLGGLGWALLRPNPNGHVQAQVIGPEPEPTGASFEQATGPRALVFPRDHGPHPDFQTEWWYYTGNLQAEGGRRFGYQLTFFRRAAQPAAERVERSSDWAAEQIYMAHFTLTDVDGRAFHAFERFERGAAGLAGARGEPAYGVWLRDWQVEQSGADTYRLRAAAEGVALDLEMLDRKGLVLQGERGYSQKGPEPGNASLYYSQTRLESRGSLTLAGQAFEVSGLSWLDREISTSALSAGQVGWDWFALQLEDGSELMAYVLRRADGTVDAFSSGTIIHPDGQTTRLSRDDFRIASEGTWRSPHSGGVYPAEWTVSVPGQDLELRVKPLLADQELNVSFIYWEGAVEVSGTRAGRPVTGAGYVELTSYAESLEGGL